MEGTSTGPAPAVDRPSSARAAAAARGSGEARLDRLTLGFADAELEDAYQHAHYLDVIGSVRVAHVLGIATWLVWGLVLRQYAPDRPVDDLVVRFGLLVPIVLAGLALTFAPWGERLWEVEAVAIDVAAVVVWTLYVTTTPGVPFELAYIGVLFVMAFAFTLNRLRFLVMAWAGLLMIGLFFAVVLAVGGVDRQQQALVLLYLVSFYALALIACHVLERSSRQLFLRERQLDDERSRSDALLLNILPRAIADRLKERADAGTQAADGGAVADACPEVAVLFADLAGFTEQAGRTSPEALVATLDDLFSEMDTLADRYGLEKIKTVGDAYMAVAGVPTAVDDPTARAMDMALDLVAALEGRRWPSGDPVGVRVGIAVGPAMAGVIGRRKFAYDVWGDTVNLASRLQSAGRPGRILVTDAEVARVGDRFVFGPPETLELKGKGSLQVHGLEGRASLRQDRGDGLAASPV
jgi:class 3 adenylate cyclase